MSNSKFIEGDIIAKKIACKYNPPIMALEYHIKSLNSDLLLEINLNECIKEYDDPMNICEWIFNTYSDVINPKVVSLKQVLNTIQRILLMRRMSQISSFEALSENEKRTVPVLIRDDEEKEFYKSNKKFYKQNASLNEEENSTTSNNLLHSNKNSAIEESKQVYSDDYIKHEISESNKINRNLSQTSDSHKTATESEKLGNLNEYFNKQKSVETSSENFNFMDEISVESLNSNDNNDDSEFDEKF